MENVEMIIEGENGQLEVNFDALELVVSKEVIDRIKYITKGSLIHSVKVVEGEHVNNILIRFGLDVLIVNYFNRHNMYDLCVVNIDELKEVLA